MAAPTFDGMTATSLSNVSPLTFSHSVGLTGLNRVLYVKIAGWMTATPDVITGVTYGGVAMTRVAQSALSAGNDRAEIWRLVNPLTGPNTVSVAFTPATDNPVFGITAESWADADQTTPDGTPQTAAGTGNPSLTVATAGADGVVTDCLGGDNTGGMTVTLDAPGGSATRTSEQNTAVGGENECASRITSPAASQTVSWTKSIANTTACAAIAINGVGAGGGGTPGSTNYVTSAMFAKDRTRIKPAPFKPGIPR